MNPHTTFLTATPRPQAACYRVQTPLPSCNADKTPTRTPDGTTPLCSVPCCKPGHQCHLHALAIVTFWTPANRAEKLLLIRCFCNCLVPLPWDVFCWMGGWWLQQRCSHHPPLQTGAVGAAQALARPVCGPEEGNKGSHLFYLTPVFPNWIVRLFHFCTQSSLWTNDEHIYML